MLLTARTALFIAKSLVACRERLAKQQYARKSPRGDPREIRHKFGLLFRGTFRDRSCSPSLRHAHSHKNLLARCMQWRGGQGGPGGRGGGNCPPAGLKNRGATEHKGHQQLKVCNN